MALEQPAQEQLKNIVERIEKLSEDITNIKADVKEIYKEAKSSGFDVKALKDIIKMRQKDKDEIEERDEIIHLYRQALGI